jgi:short-subunit dehydrogenase
MAEWEPIPCVLHSAPMATTRPLAAITGASSGIGAEFARQLAAKHFDLLLIARRKDRLEQLAAELHQSFGIDGQVIEADLTDDRRCHSVADQLAGLENLELLVNNAGFLTSGDFYTLDVESHDRMHRLHVLAPMRLSHAALSGMVRRNRGGLINVSSLAGFWQGPGMAGYCATKCWMNSFTEGLYLDLHHSGSAVKVQALCPGLTRSEIFEAMDHAPESFKSSLWMTAQAVVADSLQGLERGTLFVVPGWRYKLAAALATTMVRIFPTAMRPRAIRVLLR